jgi:hypothetical protein
MSPEQARGEQLDTRTDLFSFGVVLYEMLTGKEAFTGSTTAVIFHAILANSPPSVLSLNPALPPKADEIVRKTLEKDRDLRCQTAAELRADLKRLKRDSDSRDPPSAAPRASRSSRRRPGRSAASSSHSRSSASVPRPCSSRAAGTREKGGAKSRRCTASSPFRRGTVRNARFAPDGKTIVYSAAWEADPLEIFSKTAEGPESRALGFNGADLVAIASTGEMAISVNYRLVGTYIGTGTLSRAPLAAGAPRAVLDDVQSADWSPDGSNLAVVRNVNGRTRLEYPIGKSLYETGGWVSHPRVSPDGTTVAFVDHPLQGDDGGSISVVDATGKKRDLTKAGTASRAWHGPTRRKCGSPARRRALRARCSPSRSPAPNGSWPASPAPSPCTTSPRTDSCCWRAIPGGAS